jgi:hypothetical protein
VTEHTPTPWHAGSTAHTELVMAFRDNVECVISESDPEIDMPLAEAHANAAFIVKACNSHDALVKALQAVLTAWDALPPGVYTDDEMTAWINSPEMKGAIAEARRAALLPQDGKVE